MNRVSTQMQNRKNFPLQKSYSIEHGYIARRRSLIEDAKFESTFLKDSFDHEKISEEIGVSDSIEQSKFKIMVSIEGYMENLSLIFNLIRSNDARLEHVESRPSKKKSKSTFEVYLEIKTTFTNLIAIVNLLKQNNHFPDVVILDNDVKKENVWIPMSIWDLDKCNHLNINYNPDMDSRHPGFSDKEYRKRREEIARIAFEYRHGDVIPRVKYSADELKTWKIIYQQLSALYPTHACKQHINALKVLETECNYSENSIPQLEDVSRFLRKRTGFSLRPVAGLLTARDFLASLAFRVFQCTQYVRHSSTPLHTPEPDCVHELIGHVPLLSDPVFAEFSQEIGIASLGASDEDIIKFSTLYWFTVEFGLCKEDGMIRAYGAGLLSAFGELKHALSGTPELKPFDPATTSIQTYQDEDYQPIYFVAESFESAKEKLREYSKTIKRPYDIKYEPFTQSLKIINEKSMIYEISQQLQSDLNIMQSALGKFENLILI